MDGMTIVAIALTLLFAFLNGVHDASNVVATMISSRAFSPRMALGVAAIANLAGPLLFGVAVARTIGDEIVDSRAISLVVVIAALVGAIVWNLLTWYLGIPSSSSHCLVGGFLGAVWFSTGWQAIRINGLEKTLMALFVSPVLGFLVGYIVLRATMILSWKATPRINEFFRRSQLVTALALGFSHGTNDGQKAMGIIALILVIAGVLPAFRVPSWVIVVCALVMGLGTALGGWRLIHTLGGKFYRIRPVDGFSAQLASAMVILGASLVGGPVSTTQVVSSSIMGVGAAERISKVRWGAAQEILVAWFLTIPATALMAAGVYWLLTYVVG